MAGLDFVAIDFETANRERASVCQVGMTRVDGGRVVGEESWYVVPPTGVDSFDPWNIRIHHITPDTVARLGIGWDRALDRVEDFAAGMTLVAHNARFDRGVFEGSSRHLSLPVPPHRWEDTLALSRRTLDLPDHRLPTVARHLGIADFAHHDACADARACALIATSIARMTGVGDVDGLWPRSSRSDRGWTGPRVGMGAGRGWPDGRGGVGGAGGGHGDPGGGGGAKFYSRGYATSAALMPSASPDADPADPLFGQHVVITGELPGLDRWEVFQLLAAHGATPQKGVTRDTTLLICGGCDQAPTDTDLTRGTCKERKAADYRSRGQSIRLMGAREASRLLEGC